MSITAMVTLLGWLCYAAGAGAIVVYIVNIVSRHGWRRPWNAAGLFFTSIAASQIPTLFRNASDVGELRAATVTTVCLVAIVGLQSVIALRKRRERREEAPPAVAPELEAQ